jgi:hypothetical protein
MEARMNEHIYPERWTFLVTGGVLGFFIGFIFATVIL